MVAIKLNPARQQVQHCNWGKFKILLGLTVIVIMNVRTFIPYLYPTILDGGHSVPQSTSSRHNNQSDGILVLENIYGTSIEGFNV
jgi:hypothetical protein